MIITLTFFLTFFTYFSFSYNDLNQVNKIRTPFLFLLLLFSIWEVITLFLLGSGIEYHLLSYFYEFSFSALVLFFLTFYSFKIFTRSNRKKIFISLSKHSLFFSVLLFFMIFWLFYHKTYIPIKTDQLGDFYVMNYFAKNSIISIPLPLNYYPILYFDVGFYQFGASLNISQRLLLMPYFTMYLYFFVLSTTLYFLFVKFLSNIWKRNIYFICSIIICFIFYIYFNTYSGEVVIVGNIVSAYLLSLIIIPSIVNKQRIMHIEIYIAFFSYLFFNETSILVDWVYILSYIIAMIFVRRKYKFSLLLLINYGLLLVLSVYLIFNDFLLMKNYNYNLTYFSLKFIPYLFIILFFLTIIFICLSWFLHKYKKNLLVESNAFSFISILWYHNSFLQLDTFVLKKIEWFSSKRFSFLLKVFMLVIFILLIYFAIYGNYAFNLPEFYKSNGSNIWYVFLVIITAISYSLLGYKLIFKQSKFNVFLLFYSLLILVSFIAGWILNFEETVRLFYITLFPAFGMASFIHDAVIFIFLVLTFKSKDSFKKHQKINRPVIWKIKTNIFSYTLVSTTIPLVLVPNILNACDNASFNKFKFESISDNAYGGLSLNTIYQLEKFNFNNELTFSDIPVPVFNLSSKFNINHKSYGLYYSPEYVLKRLQELQTFKDINGNYLQFINANVLKNDIFPYYSFVVLRNSNSLFNKAIDSMRQFKLVDVINNQIDIYVNTDLSQTLQDKFLHYNNDIF